MNDSTMTIREMCETFDVTPRTLRFYEAKELLSPIRQGTKRLFTKRDRGRLTLILRGKRFGFSLEEIRQLLALYDLGDSQATQIRETRAVGQKHLDGMIAQRDELNNAIEDLREQLTWADRVLADMDQKEAAQ